ncbi:hypothetical protein ACHAW6_001226, partial [Cyclotella cf. meneghiniana]
QAIQTFKNHFIAGLCTTDHDIPSQLWDKLLPQAQDSLNMLCASRIDPSKLAYEVLEGSHNLNRHPWAPPGCRAIIHKPVDNRMSWGPQGTDAWYIGPALHHYRNMNSMFSIHGLTKYLYPHNFSQLIVKSHRKCLLKKQHVPLPNSSLSSNNNAMCPLILTFLTSNVPLKLSRKCINSTISNSEDRRAGSRSSKCGTYTLQKLYHPKNTQNSQMDTQSCHPQQHTWLCLHPRTDQMITMLKPSAAHHTHYGSAVATTYTNAARHNTGSTLQVSVLQVSVNTTSYTNWILPNN